MEIDEDQAAEVFLTDMLKNVDVSFQPILVLPGTDVTSHLKNKGKPVRIGVGLESSNSTVTCQMAGVLRYRAPGAYWIEKNTKRYIPKADDHVIGVVEEQGGDFYKVNIFTGAHALLGRESFDGATKRNKPDLKRGHLVYARVALADKDLDCELTCLVKTGPKKDWSSGESVYGELQEGTLLRISILLARKMLLPDCVVLNALGRHFAFEVAVGMNGAVWIKCAEVEDLVIIRNAIANSEQLNDVQTEAMVNRLIEVAKRRLRS